MIAALDPKFWWWVARATGIVAWLTAIASIAWGLTLSGRLVRRRRLPAWLLDLHRYLGTLTVAFVAVHMAALVADTWTYFGARELFVPMASEWRPGPVTWGVVAFYGLVIIQLTSWNMRRMPRKVWHGIHLISYGVFVTATVHAALSGADNMNPIVQGVAVSGVTLVLALTVLRVLARRGETEVVDTGSSRAANIAEARARSRAAAEAAPPPAVESQPAIDAPPPSLADRLPDPITWTAPPAALPAGPAAAPDPTPGLVAPATSAPATPAPGTPEPGAAEPATEVDPVLAARLARLGSRVKSRSGAG